MFILKSVEKVELRENFLVVNGKELNFGELTEDDKEVLNTMISKGSKYLPLLYLNSRYILESIDGKRLNKMEYLSYLLECKKLKKVGVKESDTHIRPLTNVENLEILEGDNSIYFGKEGKIFTEASNYEELRKYRMDNDDDLIIIRKNGEVIAKGMVDDLKDNWEDFEDFTFDEETKKYICEYNGDIYTVEKIIVESADYPDRAAVDDPALNAEEEEELNSLYDREIESYTCKNCGKKIPNILDWDKKHYKEYGTEYYCPYCGEPYTYEEVESMAVFKEATDTEEPKEGFIVFQRGGMLGDSHDLEDKVFKTKEEAKAALKLWRDSYGRNKSYYKPEGSIYKYKGKTAKETKDEFRKMHEGEDIEDITYLFDRWDWEVAPVTAEELGMDYSYFKLVTSVNEAERFNYHSDYWGRAEDYQNDAVEVMTDFEPYVGKTVKVSFEDEEDAKGETFVVKGMLIDKQYNSLSHLRILVEDRKILREGAYLNFDLPEGYPQEVYDKYFEYTKDIDLTDDEPLDFNEWYKANGGDIKEVSPEELNAFLEAWENGDRESLDGQKLICFNGNEIIAIDNSDGYARIETFDKKDEGYARGWLNGKVDYEDFKLLKKRVNESVEENFRDMVMELHSYVEADPKRISSDLKKAIQDNKLEDYLRQKAAMTDEEIEDFKERYLKESINEGEGTQVGDIAPEEDYIKPMVRVNTKKRKKKRIVKEDAANINDIEYVEPNYTGGGVYVYTGKLKDGNYFLGSDDWFDKNNKMFTIRVVNENPDDYEEDCWFDDWQKEHLVRDLTEEENKEITKQILHWIIENKPDGNYDIRNMEDMLNIVEPDRLEEATEEIDEHLLDLLRMKERLSYDDSISDEIAYDFMERIDNELVNSYSEEEIEKAKEKLGLNESILTEATISNEEVVNKALNYIEKEYNELGTADKGFLLSALTGGKSAENKIKKALNYMINEYNEIGSDDRYFLYNILTSTGIFAKNDPNREEVKEEEPKERKKPELSYNKKKKSIVLEKFNELLNPKNIMVVSGTGGSGSSIRFILGDSKIGIKAQMQSMKLPGDEFALSFNNTTAKKFIDKLDPLYDLSSGTYTENLGASFAGDFVFYKYEIKDIEAMSKVIENILVPKVVEEAADLKVGDKVSFYANGYKSNGKFSNKRDIKMNTEVTKVLPDGAISAKDPQGVKGFDYISPSEITEVNGELNPKLEYFAKVYYANDNGDHNHKWNKKEIKDWVKDEIEMGNDMFDLDSDTLNMLYQFQHELYQEDKEEGLI